VTAGYSETPLWKKLGVGAGDALLLVDAPRDWTVADLPEGATVARGAAPERDAAPREIVVAFFSTLGAMRQNISDLARGIFPAGALWVAWPRRAAGHESDIREQDIRSLALPLGLVDVKVAALDEDWSGLRLVWRRERRGAPKPTPE
jgi:hypothetical protein